VAQTSTRQIEKILVVIDPTRLIQPSLNKAEWVASRNGASLHLFCCVWDPDVGGNEDARAQIVEQTESWLQRLALSTREKELDATVQVSWDADWRQRIAAAARESKADLIVKTVSRHSFLQRRLTPTSDWTLLREASCPTLLVDEARPANPKVILAAVKLDANDETHTILNDRVIATAHRIANSVQGELHAATVYKGDGVFFDRQKFADRCQLPRNRVHAEEGTPARGIADIANRVNADVVILGCAAKHAPGRGVVVGYTAQRLIDEVDTDVIVIPAT
jgi:universal stress protein E